MDFPKLYNDPVLYNKRKNTYDDPYMSYDETHSILNGRLFLTENPNRENRVVVSGENIEWKEIEDGDLEDDCYRVDYMMGVVFFNSSNEGKELQVKYVGEGAHFFPAARIWVKRSGNTVVETLQGLIDEAEDCIIRMNERILECERVIKRCIEITEWCRAITSNYEYVVENTKKEYKPLVNTYTELLDTYPNPLVGWTVTVRDSGIVYRWNGFDWINISISEEFDGYDVITSFSEPLNIKRVWFRVNTPPKLRRIKPSTEEPDGGLIWFRKG
ncbi:hypothetical protein AB0R69_15500 [Bacillus pumilus]|uniref:hypothetical protein n=1 Tax=Bacillus pumilus TaxID=1408 RepID=UPI0034572AFA